MHIFCNHSHHLICPHKGKLYYLSFVCLNDGAFNKFYVLYQVIERMANSLEVASRQRTQMNGRGARLRSALELLHLVNPSDMSCILHLARFYMLYNMDLSDLMATIVKVQDVRENKKEEPMLLTATNRNPRSTIKKSSVD
jgi:hypothetical protein